MLPRKKNNLRLQMVHSRAYSYPNLIVFVCGDLNVGPLDLPLHSAAPGQTLSCNIHSRWEQSDVD